MSKKIIALILAVVIAALGLGLAGCGAKNTDDNTTETKKFIMGIDAEYPPFSYMGEDGEYTGFDVEICKAACDYLGWDFEIFGVNWDEKLIHVLLLLKVILPIGWRIEYDYGHLRWCLLGMIAVCFVMSYVFSVIYDNTAIAAANYVYDRLVLANRKKKNRHKAGNS